ncbi:DUF4230 domain-containing protein [Marinoscillum furvescens]|uniref:Uncharacterized protein DUF4230 n=1 Tax=Marinoscillum furvescens DSM 4134 TaxID=1122208 RepID=A0A3D9L3J6_MARFU|nr:DUF4230 domain-containing protein [Marinoscillum furvescens]RED99866.1 uncharacterized protein DUF4230 [Marinoscillum furvescens DSM 4134]
MIALLRIILKMLPWLIVVALLSWLLIAEKLDIGIAPGAKNTYQSALLTRVESLGKVELVRYHFQEVTEIQKAADRIDLKLFKLPTIVPDSRAVLISKGSAVGCVDLTQVKKDHIRHRKDTVYITLPAPELCYFKIDLENSRLYDLEIQGLSPKDRKLFMEELYEVAEQDIRASALKMGILEETRTNAQNLLQPLF